MIMSGVDTDDSTQDALRSGTVETEGKGALRSEPDIDSVADIPSCRRYCTVCT